ncbi:MULTISPECIES: peptidase inhibitor family I36 protein [Thermocrispum]|jgi:hypothetical protein|uniref:Peptidase inhibitor family I36 protein n=2 Tax=Thermocrispum agreste TaxID=37925 RepID=A0ABD6FDM3_9PSEU|nr:MULTISPECIES: peptidase inhibitor family I36 protein [Thermocrispum]
MRGLIAEKPLGEETMIRSMIIHARRSLVVAVGICAVLGAGLTSAGSADAAQRPALAARAVAEEQCDPGEFCSWEKQNYQGGVHRIDLLSANPDECVPLPDDHDARSFVNRMRQAVTVYQGRDCSTEGEFSTYPGGGTYVPQTRFVVRAVQVWE